MSEKPLTTETFEEKSKQALEAYRPIGSLAYTCAEIERHESKGITKRRYGTEAHSLTLIGSINIGNDGEAIPQHDRNPEAASHRNIEESLSGYLHQTTEEERLIIFEGSPMTEIASRDDAIKKDTESGLLQWFAKKNGVEAMSGEPSNEEIAIELERRGVSRQEQAAHLIVRNLISGQLRREGVSREDVSLQVFRSATFAGATGLETAEHRLKNGTIREKAEQFVPMVNELVRKEYGDDLLVVNQEGVIELNTDMDNPEEVEQNLGYLWYPDGDGRINEIARLTSEVRDSYLAELALEQYEAGKSPFIAYGGSHISSLRPVFDRYFEVESRDVVEQVLTKQAEEVIGDRDSLNGDEFVSLLRSEVQDPDKQQELFLDRLRKNLGSGDMPKEEVIKFFVSTAKQ